MIFVAQNQDSLTKRSYGQLVCPSPPPLPPPYTEMGPEFAVTLEASQRKSKFKMPT